MKRITLIVALALTLAAIAANQTYFPKGTVSDFEQEWYAKHLAAMKEPVLKPDPKDKTYFAFRVLYLPTWGRPVAVRFERKGGKITRRSVLLSGQGGYEPGEIKVDKTELISEAAFARFQSELEQSHFWSLSGNDDVRGLDGSELVIDAIKDGKHVVFDRWTPESNTEKRGLSGIVALMTRLFQETGLWKKE